MDALDEELQAVDARARQVQMDQNSHETRINGQFTGFRSELGGQIAILVKDLDGLAEDLKKKSDVIGTHAEAIFGTLEKRGVVEQVRFLQSEREERKKDAEALRHWRRSMGASFVVALVIMALTGALSFWTTWQQMRWQQEQQQQAQRQGSGTQP
jgi:hypothetical protein